MQLIPVTDRSTGVLQKIVTEHFPINAEHTLGLLQKIPNLYLISEGGNIIGYLNFKQFNGNGYCPLCISQSLSANSSEELARAICKQAEAQCGRYYIILMREPMPNLLSSMLPYIRLEDSGRDYRRPKSSKLLELGESDLRWSADVPDEKALKALHLDAYAYEKDYVFGTWDELIDNFLSSDIPKIMISCYLGNTLVGCAIGNDYDTHTYIYSICVAIKHEGQGIGAGLMRRFINQSLGKEVQLKVYANNARAVRMYEHFGFKFIDITTLVGSNIN